MAYTYSKISSISLTTTSPSISFIAIPQNYDSLVLYGSTRGTRGGAGGPDSTIGAAIVFNEDTSSIYSEKLIFSTASTSVSTAELLLTSRTAWSMETPAESSSANIFSNDMVHIYNYSSSQHKSILSDGVTESAGGAGVAAAGFANRYLDAALWEKSDPITSIKIVPQANGSFFPNCSFYLYGIKGEV